MPKAKKKPRRKRIRVPWPPLGSRNVRIQRADLDVFPTALNTASALSLSTGVVRATVCEQNGLIELETANGACIQARIEQAVMPPVTEEMPYIAQKPKQVRLKDLCPRREDDVWVLRWNHENGTALGDGFSDTPTVREARELLKKIELDGDDQHDLACRVAHNAPRRILKRTPYAWQTKRDAAQALRSIEHVMTVRKLDGKERV